MTKQRIILKVLVGELISHAFIIEGKVSGDEKIHDGANSRNRAGCRKDTVALTSRMNSIVELRPISTTVENDRQRLQK